MKLVPSSSDLPELGKDCYYLVLDGARRDILLSRAKPADRILTLREFCERGLALYSEKPVISRGKELALLASVISEHGRIFGKGAMVEMYRLMDELSKNFREIKPESEKLEELGRIISLHYSYLDGRGVMSRTMIEREALSLMESGMWFPVRRVYLEFYPIVSEVENRIAGALDSVADLFMVSSDSKLADNYLAFADASEELESVARMIIKENIAGTSLESMAVITPKADYLPVMEEILDEYSIPHTNYAYAMLRDTRMFEFISRLAALKNKNFRTTDIVDLFSSPLVRYGSVERQGIKRAEKFMGVGGIDRIENGLGRAVDEGEIETGLADDVMKALRAIDAALSGGVSSVLSLMHELGVVRSMAFDSLHPSADASLRRESIAYRKITDAIRDMAWAERLVGKKAVIEDLVDLLYDESCPAVHSGGVAVLLDKSGFWGGFQKSFYCGLSMGALYPEESGLLSESEAEMLGVLERGKSAEIRKRIVIANMRDTVTCVVNDSGFTVFEALGLTIERIYEKSDVVLSKADFERALANRPELIDHAGILGEDYIARIKSAEHCVRSREGCETDEYNGILGRSVDLNEVSIVALEDYVRCPFYCFAKHILGLRDQELEDRRDIVWGNAVHRAMRALYSDDSGGIDMDFIALRGLPGFTERGMKKIEEIMLEYVEDPYLAIRVKRALRSSFPEVLRIEQNTDSVPVQLEQPLSAKLCDVILKGRADRIDVHNGKVFVYDYKTGSGSYVSPGNPELMQIPLYLYMDDRLYGGGYYYQISDSRGVEKKEFFGSCDVHDVVDDVVRERVPAIVESIKEGFFPARYMKRSKSCRECEMRRACYTKRRMVLPFPFDSYVRRRKR